VLGSIVENCPIGDAIRRNKATEVHKFGVPAPNRVLGILLCISAWHLMPEPYRVRSFGLGSLSRKQCLSLEVPIGLRFLARPFAIKEIADPNDFS